MPHLNVLQICVFPRGAVPNMTVYLLVAIDVSIAPSFLSSPSHNLAKPFPNETRETHFTNVATGFVAEV